MDMMWKIGQVEIENPFVLGKMPVPLFYGAEGTLYIEFCSDCYIVSMQHQQT